MSEDSYTCQKHGFTFLCIRPSEARERGIAVGCPQCAEELREAQDPARMTGDERADELMRLLSEPATAEFSVIHERVAALVGRDVWTHELAQPGPLVAEARDWQHPGNLAAHLVDGLQDLMGDKPVVVVETP